MKRLIAPIAVFLIWAISAAAQTPPLPDAPVAKVVASVSAIAFKGANGTQTGTAFFTGLQVTKAITCGYEQINVSGLAARFQNGICTYSNTADKFIGKKLSSKTLLDLSNYVLTIGGGGGKLLSPTGNHIDETFLASLSYPIPGGKASVQVVSYQYLHAPNNWSGSIQSNSTQQVTSGLIFHIF